jgi:glucosamine--fructose-6-phosphate aminotransferase (isomerizing)
MFTEAAESARAVAAMLAANAGAIRGLAARLRARPPVAVVTCARGSSDNAATYARYLIETAVGAITSSMGLSVGSLYGADLKLAGGLCLAISQSGASPDLLAAVERAKAGGALAVALVNVPDSPLASLADEVITLAAGPERSVAATKSFITAQAALAWLTAEWAGDADLLAAVQALPELLAEAWALDWSAALAPLATAQNIFTIGRGPGLGVAQEAALKLKETSAIHAEAISAAEVRHGPMALAQPGFTAFVFAQDDAALATTRATAAALVERGAQVILAGAEIDGGLALPTIAAHPAVEPVLLAQAFYRLTAELSVLRGHDPDHPPHLAKVTRTL